MVKLIKAIIVGYIALWAYEWLRKSLAQKDIETLEDVKQFIKQKIW